jgi:hypothetical protein
MDHHLFDALAVALTHLTRRRRVVGALAGGAVALHGATAAVAAKKAQRRRRRRRERLRRRCLAACGDKPGCNYCLHGVGIFSGIGCVATVTPICSQECTGETELECGLFNGCHATFQPIGGAKKTALCGSQFAVGVCTAADSCM